MTASEPARKNHRWLPAAIVLALSLVTFLVYFPVRHHDLLNWDDLTYLANNDHVKGGITWEGVKWAFSKGYSANWHPLTWLSHMLDCQIYGLQPGGHHLTSVIFHSANAALLFLVLRSLTRTIWRSAFVAALFALHPLHVESVAWVAERKDVLSTFFFLLTIWAYARYAESKDQKSSRSKRDKIQNYVLALFFFALGLMSKPMLVTLPFVLLLLDFWPLQRLQTSIKNQKSKIKNLFLEKLPFFLLSLASSVITFLAQKQGGAVASLEHLTLTARLENAAVAYVEYLLKFLWPVNLSPLYPHPEQWASWRVAGAVALLGFLTVAAWLGRRRFPFLLVGWFWYLGTLVPVIGIVQVGSQAFADRYTYIPLIGIMIALAWLASALTGLANEPVALFQREPAADARFSPHPSGVKNVLAALFSVSLIALLAWRTSQQLAFWKDTETLFRRALALAPNNVQALYGLGSNLIDVGRVEEGKRLLERVISLEPRYPEALGTMGNTLDAQGKYDEAIAFYDAALKAQPDHPGVLNNLAWLRAACQDPSFRNGAEAVRLATRACELTGYSRPLFIGTLAAAQAEAGDFPAAIATGQKAAALADALRLEDTAARNRQLIELYRSGKAAHGGTPKG